MHLLITPNRIIGGENSHYRYDKEIAINQPIGTTELEPFFTNGLEDVDTTLFHYFGMWAGFVR